MSQNSLNVPDGSGAAVRANINLALDTLNTLNSGPSAPANPEAYMLWADTGTGYLWQRNAANSAWVAIRPLDGSCPVSTNSGNAYSITLDPAITHYIGGVIYKFIPNVSSTGTCTLSINGLPAVTISGAGLQANHPVMLIYDATDVIFIMAGGGGGISSQNVVTGSRAFNTLYQNTTGKPMFVNISFYVSAAYTVKALTDNNNPPTTAVCDMSPYGSEDNYSFGFWVLTGNYYEVTTTGPCTLSCWTEWY